MLSAHSGHWGQFAGIKDSSGDYEYYAALKKERDSQGWTLLVGIRLRLPDAGGMAQTEWCPV